MDVPLENLWSYFFSLLIVMIICKKYFLGMCTYTFPLSCCKKWLFSLTKIVLLLSPALLLYPVSALNGQTTLQAKKMGRKSVNQKENTDWPMHKRNTGCLSLTRYKLNDSECSRIENLNELWCLVTSCFDVKTFFQIFPNFFLEVQNNPYFNPNLKHLYI